MIISLIETRIKIGFQKLNMAKYTNPRQFPAVF